MPLACRPLLKDGTGGHPLPGAPWLAEDERWKPRTVLLSALAGPGRIGVVRQRDARRHHTLGRRGRTPPAFMRGYRCPPCTRCAWQAWQARRRGMLGRWLGRKRDRLRGRPWQPPAVVIQTLRAAPDAQPMCRFCRPRAANKSAPVTAFRHSFNRRTLHQPRGSLRQSTSAASPGPRGKGIARGPGPGQPRPPGAWAMVMESSNPSSRKTRTCRHSRSHPHAGHGGQQAPGCRGRF